VLLWILQPTILNNEPYKARRMLAHRVLDLWLTLHITWQESSQCVTEQCRCVRPSMTCISSVLAFAHARFHSSETTTSHLFYNQQFGATIQLFATTRQAIPTLYTLSKLANLHNILSPNLYCRLFDSAPSSKKRCTTSMTPQQLFRPLFCRMLSVLVTTFP
jgi:hypothetical protein